MNILISLQKRFIMYGIKYLKKMLEPNNFIKFNQLHILY
jgi:hypothetical protein